MMSAITGVCPACGVAREWRIDPPSFSLPPTGGDYEWVETDVKTVCPACSIRIEVRVQIDLETGTINRLASSPRIALRAAGDLH